jgi:uncharacterized protein YbjQ (UPF0145 family)
MTSTAGARPDHSALVDAALDVLARPARHGRSSVATSDLSVDEGVVLAEIGYEPQSFVMGSAVYHVGWSFTGGGQAAELVQLSGALHSARNDAMARMSRDARQAGGDGVVGVRLTVTPLGGRHGHLVEFTAMGTAVADTSGRHKRRAGIGRDFFTSDLSGQELYLLLRAGWEPLGLVFGVCVYQTPWGSQFGSMGQNGEMEVITTAMYQARELAMQRVQEDAMRLRAAGVVGMHIVEESRAWGARAIEFMAVGTAVGLVGDQHQPLQPRMALSLEDEVVATDVRRLTKPGGSGEG